MKRKQKLKEILYVNIFVFYMKGTFKLTEDDV